MSFRDNGVGFKLDEVKQGFGIKNLHSRVQLINIRRYNIRYLRVSDSLFFDNLEMEDEGLVGVLRRDYFAC